MHPGPTPLRHAFLPALLLLAPAATSLATAATQGPGDEILFSITFRGPTISQPATGSGVLMTEGDLLSPALGIPDAGPQPRPRIVLTGGALGLSAYTNCVGHLPGETCGVELDALSRGRDPLLLPDGLARSRYRFLFSVDNRALGIPGMAAPPSVWTEGPAADASADVFVELGLPSGPLPPPAGPPPFAPPAGSVGLFDGNGIPSATGARYPGLGLVEPNPPSTQPASPGDDLNALDVNPHPAGVPQVVYFSLDAGFTDPLTGLVNAGSAALQGASGAAVLRSLGGVITVFATPQQLGLELVAGDVDDIDALVLHENGDGIYQRSLVPYDWTSGQRDLLLFSVRRGSSVIGRLDSIFGLPIEPGDLLVPPLSGSGNPGIFIAAENLGLRTVRSGTAMLFGDDLDAVAVEEEPFYDCNNNGIEDAVDIALGISSDADFNGIPDECEVIGGSYCYCPSPKGPCGNHAPSAGCINGTGQGSLLAVLSGSGSVTLDDLAIRATSAPPSQPGLFFMGGAAIELPFGNGLRCVGSGGVGLHRYQPTSSGPLGQYELSPATLGMGIVAKSQSLFPPSGWIQPGATWYFQAWFRDPSGPCALGYNLSNGLWVTFTP